MCVYYLCMHIVYIFQLCMCVSAFIENIATGGLSACCSDSGSPLSFYSRRMGIIYTCSQGHSPHIYYTTLTGAAGSQDALLATVDLEQPECVEEKGIGKLREKFSPLKGNADFINTQMFFSSRWPSFQSVMITFYMA